MTHAVSKAEFLREFGKELIERKAILFVGAGLSIPAGFVDWRNLLRELAEDLGLDVDRETDLLSVAQFHHNVKSSRNKIDQKLLDEFARKATPTRNHTLIASLPVETVWTTNYDTLLEDAFRDVGRRPEVKHSKEQLSKRIRGADVTIYKMHGDISMPHEAVLTRDDYEEYDIKRSLFSEKLQGDLVSDTILFLGFSFTDPNIDFILRRIRILLGTNRRTHYCIMRRPLPVAIDSVEAKDKHEYEVRKFELRMQDLKRYGIETVLIDDYAEVEEILQELNRVSHLREVFVSGSAHDYLPLGKDHLVTFCQKLGRSIIAEKLNLISGFGLGVGSDVSLGAIEAVYTDTDGGLEDRVMLRPFPQSTPAGMDLPTLWEKYRRDMIAQAGHAVFIAGNKLNGGTGSVIPANGVRREFEIAREAGKTLIPFGASGHVAAELWQEVYADRCRYFPGFDVSGELETLNDPSAAVDAHVASVVRIIKKVSR